MLDMRCNLSFVMDYSKTREDANARKDALTLRALAIMEERKNLDAEVEQIRRELIGLDQILDGVEFMTSEIPPDLEPPGFTDKIRKILSDTQIPLVPTQVRDALEAAGSKGSSSRNLLISVHTVIERIKSELEESATPEGKTAYKRKIPWSTPYTVSLMDILNFGSATAQRPGAADILGRTSETTISTLAEGSRLMRKADTSQKARDFSAYLQNATNENKAALGVKARTDRQGIPARTRLSRKSVLGG